MNTFPENQPPDWNIITRSVRETLEQGKQLAKYLKSGDIVLFRAPLGAGKTVFIRGIARGLGYPGKVTSPTFTILHPYPTSPSLYHFDLYRIEPKELKSLLAWEEFLFGNGISAIEWGEKLLPLLESVAYWWIEIIPGESLNQRLIKIEKKSSF